MNVSITDDSMRLADIQLHEDGINCSQCNPRKSGNYFYLLPADALDEFGCRQGMILARCEIHKDYFRKKVLNLLQGLTSDQAVLFRMMRT